MVIYGQIYIQLYGILFTTGWSAVVTVIIFFIVDKLCGGMRVPEEHEVIGLDIASHNETILAMPRKKLAALIATCDLAALKKPSPAGGDWDLDEMHHGDRGGRDELEEEEEEEEEESKTAYRHNSLFNMSTNPKDLNDDDLSVNSSKDQNDDDLSMNSKDQNDDDVI
jgi:hypothetical protein